MTEAPATVGAPTEGGGRRPRAAGPRSGGRLRGLAYSAPPVLVVVIFIGLPVLAAIFYSLGYFGGPNSVIASLAQHQHPRGGHLVSTGAYRDVFTSKGFRRNLWVTVWVTAATVVVVLVVAWAIALYVRLIGSRLAKLVSALSVVPLFIPMVIASYSVLTFFAADGLPRAVAAHLGFHHFPTIGYTTACVLAGQIWVSIPFGVLMLTSGLSAVPDALIEAARDAGASLPRAVRSVLVPMNVVPTVIVATFTAITVLGSFTVPYLTGPSAPNMLGPAMTNYFSSFNQAQQATVMAIVVFVIAAGVGFGYVRANVKSAKRSGVVS